VEAGKQRQPTNKTLMIVKVLLFYHEEKRKPIYGKIVVVQERNWKIKRTHFLHNFFL
jgi:hypothetical protein